MLQTLYIKDFALINEIEIPFESGLTIITGQTGAGKSILIGALNMVLGERADTDLVRKGSKKAVVEAVFTINDKNELLRSIFEENEIEWTNQLILRREIRPSGSRAFINDSPVSIQVLKQVGDQLVDLHGQHDHQLLLKEEHHRLFIDQFSSIRQPLSDYQQALDGSKQAYSAWQKLKKQDKDLKEKLELYAFQLKELEEAQLYDGEEEELLDEMQKLDNAEFLDQKASSIQNIISDGEVTIEAMISTLISELKQMNAIDSDFTQYLEEAETAKITFQELSRFAESYQNQIEFNPERLEELRQRHQELKRLQKKYLKTIPELIEYRDELDDYLSNNENIDIALEKKEKAFSESCSILSEKAKVLRSKRATVAEKLNEQVIHELNGLGIQHAQFHLVMSPMEQKNGWITLENQQLEATDFGPDSMQFFISTNKGIDPKPLSKIASGGEISRVMLALKTVFASDRALPLMVFDEIDTGISGSVSEKVGRAMRALSKKCQIISITHQPQIASFANQHYVVKKSELENDTQTQIELLTKEAHIREVAILMSGEFINEATLESAKQLIESANS